jgi:endonuclease YncB( thermonuclease family)
VHSFLKTSIFSCIILLLFSAPLFSQEIYKGQVISVQDGDTITVRTEDFEQMRVRFYGIDAPEKDQPYGPQAKEYLSGLLYGESVELEVLDVDRYSRYVCLVKLGGKLVNVMLAENGYAWTYEAYCKNESVCNQIRDAEERASEASLGLWGDPEATPPWDHRKSKRKK